MDRFVSPKRVAQALGVSESSLKRWCDKGMLPTNRTAGGHRKLALADVLSFLRQQGKSLIHPELLGLPQRSQHTEDNWDALLGQFSQAIQNGDSTAIQQIIYDLYLGGHSIAKICDHLICAAMREMGENWSCGSVEVYAERRACELISKHLHDLGLKIPLRTTGPVAMGGTLTGDYYQLPTQMVELVLQDQGWQASSLGCNLPSGTLGTSMRDHQPRLFWLSISYFADRELFLQQYHKVAATAAELQIPLAIGGQALTTKLRSELSYTVYCENLQDLLNYSQSLIMPKSTLTASPAVP
ncbi:MAG: helix-turn-helix domain-containing protein [Pirellulales bacterium]|nr:helix-turn-helix domain-containing protein [Pirellulales bacterium]